MRSLSFSALLLAAVSLVDARDFIADPELSLGLRSPFSEDRRTLPGWQIQGNAPQILSDRMLLTPPVPGNQRAGVWSQKQLTYEEWSVKLEFRSNGAERPGGSLNLWYTQSTGMGTNTVYSSKPFDGLGIVIESRDAGVGSLRAYLNDNRLDFSAHHNPPTLAFGHCAFHYRNKGVLSSITLTQSLTSLKVETDGTLCFETTQVRLPRGYYLGITGATTDPPDSFEIFSLITSSPETAQKIKYGDHKLPPQDAAMQHNDPQKVQGDRAYQQQEKRDEAPPSYQQTYSKGKSPHERDLPAWELEQGEEDHVASFYNTQTMQFEDIHNRLQALTHHLASLQQQLGKVYDHVDFLHNKEESLRAEYRGTRVPREQIDNIDARVGRMEKLLAEVGTQVMQKDYGRYFEDLHKTIREQHSNLLYAVPDSVTQVIESGKSSFGKILMLLVVLQVVAVAGYVLYKRRKNSSPKKYL